jgi:hypothetical protein
MLGVLFHKVPQKRIDLHTMSTHHYLNKQKLRKNMLTFQKSREPAKHLVYVTMRVTNR